jgi:hypothetical protein
MPAGGGMSWLVAAWSELVGLFVDDAPFAAAIAAWLAASWLVLPRLAPEAPWPPLVLFAGLAVILAGSAVAKAKRAR